MAYGRIKIVDIQVKEDRQREEFGDISQLSISMAKYGIIQPIILSHGNVLVAGERRLRAAKMLKWEEIDFVDKGDITDLLAEELELEENIKRKNLSFKEECLAIQRIQDKQQALHGDPIKDKTKSGWSIRDTAVLMDQSLGKTQQDLAVAKALTMFPQLEDCKTKKEVIDSVKKISKDAALMMLKDKVKNIDITGKDDSAVRKFSLYSKADVDYNIGDTMAGLKKLSDETPAVFAEVDPPYAVDLKKVRGDTTLDKSNFTTYHEVTPAKYSRLMETVMTELYRTLAEDAWCIVWFSFQHFDRTMKIIKKAGFKFDQVPSLWVKENFTGHTPKPKLLLARSYEQFFVCRKGNPSLNKEGRSNVYTFKTVPPNQKTHLTEKPVELYKEILNTFMLPGQVAIIPFLGSGVTLRATYQLGMQGFGWDLSEEHKNGYLLAVQEDIDNGLYVG